MIMRGRSPHHSRAATKRLSAANPTREQVTVTRDTIEFDPRHKQSMAAPRGIKSMIVRFFGRDAMACQFSSLFFRAALRPLREAATDAYNRARRKSKRPSGIKPTASIRLRWEPRLRRLRLLSIEGI